MKRPPDYSAKYRSQFIRLTQGVIALVDPCTLSKFGRLNWCALKIDHRWYAVRSVKINNKRSLILMHREIINAPEGIEVDHPLPLMVAKNIWVISQTKLMLLVLMMMQL